jgi:O-antigen/teichoic acid export membrane protein
MVAVAGGTLVSRGVEALTRVLIARSYGSGVLGAYAVAYTLIEMGSALAAGGLGNAIIRSYASAGRDTRGTLNASLRITAVSSIAVSVVVALAVYGGALQTITVGDILPLALAVIFVCWWRLLLSVTQALRVFRLKVLVEDTLGPTLRGTATIGLLGFGLAVPTAASFGAVSGAALAMGFALIWPSVGRKLRSEIVAVPQPSQIWRLVSFGAPIVLAAVFELVISQSDLLVVQATRSPRDVGIYAAASTISRILPMLSLGAAYVYSPYFAVALARGRVKGQHLHQREIDLYRFASAAVALSVACFAPEFMSVVFGAEFDVAARVLVVLLIGNLVLNVSGFNANQLLLAGHSRAYAVSRGFAAVVAIILYVVLVPAGIVGVALAASAALTFGAVQTSVLSRKLLGTPTNLLAAIFLPLPLVAAYALVDSPLQPRLLVLSAGAAFLAAAWLLRHRVVGSMSRH